ncbi:MAG TPA: hypothetical protein VFA90_13415 [Terriglobales bacterium]|nr:hypothetical protein [Terriglobales bacterium]
MKWMWVLLLLCASSAGAGDFKDAKVLHVRDASALGASVAGNASYGVSTAPSIVPGMVPKCEVTVALDGKSYSAVYVVDKHFKMADLVEGQEIPAQVEGNKLVLKRPMDGKAMKAKIVHQGPIEAEEK